MSESNEIVLRQVPGREATASEIARSRGELRRHPHVTDAPAAEATDERPAPKTAAKAKPSVKTIRVPAADKADYGRGRLHH
jgi:hypothetical protein